MLISGNHFDGNQYQDDKNNQWFGASVASRGGVLAVSKHKLYFSKVDFS